MPTDLHDGHTAEETSEILEIYLKRSPDRRVQVQVTRSMEANFTAFAGHHTSDSAYQDGDRRENSSGTK